MPEIRTSHGGRVNSRSREVAGIRRARAVRGAFQVCAGVAAALLGLASAACDRSADVDTDRAAEAEPERPGPATAQWDLVDNLREDRAAPRHASDGGGRAWLLGAEATPSVHAGERRGWSFVYEAGELGVEAGGSVYFAVSPFFGWSPPQNRNPGAPGFTRVSSEVEGVEVTTRMWSPPYVMQIEIGGRALAAGDQLRVEYGSGALGAISDRYAERGEWFRFAVDGDGDGVREWLADSIAVNVTAGPAARLLLHLPSTARPGATVSLVVAALDATGNAGVDAAGPLRFPDPPAGLDLPVAAALGPDGLARVDVVVREPGTYRLVAEGPGGLGGQSNPMWVLENAPSLLWGDLHGHSNYSDGTGLPEDYFRYARDVARLDVVSLTDHDHWGIPFLDERPERWAEIQRQVERFHEPGRFVTLLGFEWTSWIYGHRHVLYFDREGPLLSSIDPATESPRQLWEALRGRRAMTFAHHSAGGPIATDWSIPPDPELEPLTEIVSVHGSSESPDTPMPIYQPVEGNWVRDALGRGYRLGFVGSGDSHDGHPGLAHLAAPSGGMAGIWSTAHSRDAVLEALRARRVYATNGPRIVLLASLGGRPMGARVPPTAPGEEPPDLTIRALGERALTSVDVVHNGAVVDRVPCEGRREVTVRWSAAPLRDGDYLYVRVIQEDEGAAWSSPFFVGGDG